MMRLIIKFVLLAFICCGCPVIDPIAETIDIHNNTANTIFVSYSCGDSIELNPELLLYETLIKEGIEWKYAPNYRVPAFTTKSIIACENREDYVKQCKNQTVSLFVISEKTMKSYSWEDIYLSQRYDSRILLTADELKRQNWTVLFSD